MREKEKLEKKNSVSILARGELYKQSGTRRAEIFPTIRLREVKVF